MPDRGQAGRFLRSLLTAEFVLRLAAVLLAALVVGDALVSGTAGFWSVFLALAAVGAVWAAVGLFGRLRQLLRQAGAESDEWAAAARVAARAVTRGRARLAAVLALLVLVLRAAVSGYVGVWTILAAVTLAALATLLSSNLRVVGLLAGTAVVFAAGTVFVANMFQGSGEARALAVSVGAVVLPLVASDKLVKLVKEPALTAAHRAILAALTLMLGFLGWTRADWLPGVLHGCYTLPTSTGMTVLSATAGGERCYGLLDNVDAGVFAAPAFGRDPVTTALERRILEHNQPLRAGDLTVVWLGALSCEPSPADATRCADGRDYPAERDQLRAMLFAQAQIRATTGHRVHVVIADAAQDVAHADDIARLLIAHREAYGPRLVVIGGGDSRDTTQRAINRLLDAGIPFIAPNLLADLGAAGRPFVDRPGYLQLAPSNLDYAKDAMTRLTNRFPGGFRLDVYQHLDPTDQYTTSLVNDLLLTVKSAPGATARHLSSLDRIDESVCAATTSGPPTVLFFADRWTRFADFVQRIDDVCGHSAPRLVLADGSVSRFMANYQLRAVSNAPWPVDYYVGGPSCADLTPAAMATFTRQIYAERGLLNIPGTFQCVDRASGTPDRQLLHACPLDAAVKLTSQPCFPNDLGTFLAPAWDAVHLADALLPARRPAGRDYLTSLNIDGLELSSGAPGTVNDGRLATPTVAVRLWHVDALDDPAHILERPGPELTLPTDRIPGTGRPAQ